MRFNIAIDGPSASGKSTIAKGLARIFNFKHIDTGAMYRAVAYHADKCLKSFDDEDVIVDIMEDIQLSFDENGHIHLNGKDINDKIHTKKYDLLTSKIASYPKVRAKLVNLQQAMAKEKGYVMDGRDIGTVVLPDAEVKIFQTASIESRAQRRFNDYKKRGLEVDYQSIYTEIERRDYQDSHRAASPLKKAGDALILDTSKTSVEESIELAYQLVRNRIEERKDKT